MKYTVTVYLLLSFSLGAYGQSYPEFSPLSGSSYYHFSTTKAGGSIFYCLRRVVGDTATRFITYKLNEEGQITDSVAHSPDGIDRWGWISAQGERIFFTASVGWAVRTPTSGTACSSTTSNWN